jgi:hypothetical protein
LFTTTLPSHAAAQSSFWIDAALSSARPPAGVPEANTSTYAVFGGRADVGVKRWRLEATASTGQAFERGGGGWWWLEADVTRSFARLGGFLLDYGNAFNYAVGGLNFEPHASVFGGKITLRPTATLASWSSDSASATFGAVGLSVSAEQRVGKITFQLTGDVHSAGHNGYSSGRYLALGADAYTALGRTSLGAGITLGRNPVESETGFDAWAAHAFSERLQLSLQLSRPLADPVFGSPGTFGVTLNGSWRVLHKRAQPAPSPALVGRQVRNGRSVRFVVRLPRARSVAVSGTFSDWEPVPMRKDGDVWTVEIPVSAGTHQYGFLVDEEEWYLPSEVKDVIDDGFGRKNATLVVQSK